MLPGLRTQGQAVWFLIRATHVGPCERYGGYGARSRVATPACDTDATVTEGGRELDGARDLPRSGAHVPEDAMRPVGGR